MTPLLSSSILRAQSDERLLKLAAAGHDRAFEAIVERYRKPLQRYLRRLLSDNLAEDIVQATFVNAWAALRAGTEVRDLRPWLYRIAHNAAVNTLKRAGDALEEIPESVGDLHRGPETEYERREEFSRTLGGIAQLPDRQRAALLAVAVDGRAHADVAKELGLTDGAVRQLVHRARHTLRAAATAMTPLPVLQWSIAGHEATVARIAEVAAGAGGAGIASVSLKAGAAAVLATGAIAAGGPHVAQVVTPEKSTPAAAHASAAKAGQAGGSSSAAGASSPNASGGDGPSTKPVAATADDEKADRKRSRHRRRKGGRHGSAEDRSGRREHPAQPRAVSVSGSGSGSGPIVTADTEDRSGPSSGGDDGDHRGRGRGRGGEDSSADSSGKGKGGKGKGKHRRRHGSSGSGRRGGADDGAAHVEHPAVEAGDDNGGAVAPAETAPAPNAPAPGVPEAEDAGGGTPAATPAPSPPVTDPGAVEAGAVADPRTTTDLIPPTPASGTSGGSGGSGTSGGSGGSGTTG